MADGRLIAEAHVTRPGIFEYKDATFPGGIRRELRPDSEVYHQDSLDSLANLPITVGHPPKLLTAATAKQYMVGSTGDHAERDDDHVKAKVMIADAGAIKRMDSAREVSLGYKCEVDETPGIDPRYGRYDAVQRKIRGNHLAVAVGSARAGREARVRMDDELSDEERIESANKIGDVGNHAARLDAINPGGPSMDPEKLKEALRAVEADHKIAVAALAKEKERADSAETERDVERGKISILDKEIVGLRATIAAGATANETAAITREKDRADAAEKAVARFDETFEKKVRERTSLMLKASTVMGHDFRMDDMDERAIKVAVVQRLDASEKLGADVELGVITGKFDTLVKAAHRNAHSLANVETIMGAVTKTETRTDSKDERQKALREQGNKPLPNTLRFRGAGKAS